MMMISWLRNGQIRVLVCMIFAFVLLLLAHSVATAQGQTFVVNSTGDEPDADPTDGVCAIVSSPDQCTLRAAIQQANHSLGRDEITFALTLPATISFNHDISITEELAIVGPGVDRLTIDNHNEYRHFSILMPSAATERVVTISQLTLANGRPNGGGHGGAIYFAQAGSIRGASTSRQVLELTSVVFRHNYSRVGEGGALYINGQDAVALTATLTDVTFVDNYADGSGGAIFALAANLDLHNTHFINNSTTEHGGAIYCRLANSIAIDISEFVRNVAGAGRNGGAIHCDRAEAIRISRSTFTENGAGDRSRGNGTADGGALFLEFSATTIVTSTFSANRANYNGGAITNSGALTITGSQLTNNIADSNGGALYTRSEDDITLLNNRFENNSANMDGGAINNQGNVVYIVNNAFTNNRAANDGGALYNIPLGTIGTTITLSNSTLLNNHADQFGGALYNGSSLSVTPTTPVTTTINIIATALISNSAGASGGAIYSVAKADSGLSGITHHHVAVSANAQFSQNVARGAGGAIYMEVGTLTVNDSGFQANRAVASAGDIIGGGGAIAATESIVQLTNSEFARNVAETNSGGAVTIVRGRVEITDSLFLENSAPNSEGGALRLGSLSTWTLANTRVENNRAGRAGGGIFSVDSNGVIADSILSGNQVPSGTGGAIRTDRFTSSIVSGHSVSTLTIVNSLLSENLAGVQGGAIYNRLSNVAITGSTLRNNTVTLSPSQPLTTTYGGGAILNNGQLTLIGSTLHDNNSDMLGGALFNTAQAFVINSTVSGNKATTGGGAIYNVGVFSGTRTTVTILNSTVTRNQADVGGGIFNTAIADSGTSEDVATIIIGSSILAGNTSNGLANDCVLDRGTSDLSPALVSSGYNIFTPDASTTCRFEGPGDQALPADQLFNTVLNSTLADNGGPSATHALLSGSPALDQIPPNINSCATEVKVDQRGVGRPIGRACDIGAYEAIQPALSISKTVGVEPNTCAPTSTLTAFGGSAIYYCLVIRNSDHITVSSLSISDPVLTINRLPLTLTLAPGATRLITHAEVSALGPITVAVAVSNTIDVTATTAPLPVTGERLTVHAVATATVAVIPVYTLTLTRTVAVKPVGYQQDILARVVDHQNDPAPGLVISFTVRGANPVSATSTTNTEGITSFVYTGINNITATDTITATMMPPMAQDGSSQGALDATSTITAAWRPITITVRGVGERSAGGVERTVTAFVTTLDTGEPVDGLWVGFTVTGTNEVLPQTKKTSGGEVVFNYISNPPPARTSLAPETGRLHAYLIPVTYRPSRQRQDPAGTGTDIITVWVDLNQDGQQTVGEPEKTYEVPALITLASFEAQRNPNGSVTVTWRTAVELDNAGFNLYRAPRPDGPYTPLNAQLIAAQGMGMGANYRYVDWPPDSGPFYYILEDVDYYGVRTQHGPRRATESEQADGDH